MRWTHLICLLGIVSFLGCGSGAGNLPVTGTVTLDGQPLAGASVTFSPTGGEGQAAAGITDEAGKYSLNCQAGTGALPGSYGVAINKVDPKFMEEQGLAAMGETDADMDAAYGAAEDSGVDLASGAREEAAPNLVPLKYTNATTSGLTAEIKADGENVIPTFELSSK